MRYIIFSMIFGAGLISACTKTEDPGTTTAVKVANEWWVNNKAGDDVMKITTYNTESNPDSIWINSLDTIGVEYRIKCKIKVDLNSLTFSTQNQRNLSLHKTNTLTITNGIILPKVGHSRAGNPTDSIYLELQYSDEPGKTYKISGHARTMFEEDEY
jgi:hypothetical protein